MRINTRFHISLCVILSLVPIWAFSYLPLTDLPQHEAQLHLLTNLNDTTMPFHQWFDVNWFTPYSFFFFLGRLLTLCFPPLIAMKILLSITIFLFPISFYYLLKQTKGPVILAFLGFPLAYGGNFFLGHIPFLFSIPLGLIFWTVCLQRAERPNRNNQVGVVLLSILLFFTHFFSFLFYVGIILTISKRKIPLFYLVSPSLFLAALWFSMAEGGGHRIFPFLWWIGPKRFFEIPQYILGLTNDWISALSLLCFLISLVLIKGKVSKKRIMWIPFGVTALICFFGPFGFYNGPYFIAQRFSVLLMPTWFMLLNDSKSKKNNGVVGSLIFAGTLLFLVVTTVRFYQFNQQTADFNLVLEESSPGKSLIMNDRVQTSPPGLNSPTIHFGAYYQIKKSGLFEHTFSNYNQQTVLYKPGLSLCPVKQGRDYDQTDMSWGYDYYLVHSDDDEEARLNQGAKKHMTLKSHHGKWWLFERKS